MTSEVTSLHCKAHVTRAHILYVNSFTRYEYDKIESARKNMISSVSSSFLLVGAFVARRIRAEKKKKTSVKKTGRKVFRVYMDGCFDLMHFGHANALRQARAIASVASTGGGGEGDVEGAGADVELIVGLVSDEEILRCKGPPVLPEQERVKCVRAVKWVDDIIANVPYELTKEFVEELFSEKYGIDCIVHGDDPCYLPDGTDAYAIPKALGKYREIKRTEGVSTTDLVARLLEYADASENTTSILKKEEEELFKNDLRFALEEANVQIERMNVEVEKANAEASKANAERVDMEQMLVQQTPHLV